MHRDEAVLYVNGRLCRLLGRAPEGLRGTDVWRLFHEADRERVRASAAGDGYECRLLRADEHRAVGGGHQLRHGVPRTARRPAELLRHLRPQEGRDPRRELAELARRQEEQLEHSTRLAELGEMAAAISHELNQPLTGIRNYARNSFYMLEKRRAAPRRSRTT